MSISLPHLSGSNHADVFDIENILQHEKCVHFTQEYREHVRIAYALAQELHSKQERFSDDLYIRHIDRSILLYLNETLYSYEVCNPGYLTSLILHDCVEDNANGLQMIINRGFDIQIIKNILWMSKPTEKVISQVMKLEKDTPVVFESIKASRFTDLYDLVNQHQPDDFVRSLEPNDNLSIEMCAILKEIWQRHYQYKYYHKHIESNRHKIYAEYMFLSMIATMPRELFRIKGTERRDNMQDIKGLLKPERVKSAEGTMFTTMAIYVPRAREILDERLVEGLIKDRNSERATFVEYGPLSSDPI